MGKRTLLYIMLIVIVVFAALKIVPLKVSTADFGSRSFTVTPETPAAITAFLASKGGTISGSFNESRGRLVDFTIMTRGPESVTVYQKTASSGSFAFTSDEDRVYLVTMESAFSGMEVTVILQANEITRRTFI